jgi:hypothetical protein
MRLMTQRASIVDVVGLPPYLYIFLPFENLGALQSQLLKGQFNKIFFSFEENHNQDRIITCPEHVI